MIIDVEKNIKVSIITVCFNSAKTLEQTIKSVINQSYNNIEYIIIDGGSTDGTLDIIKKYEDKITYWVSEPDNGLYDAMNKGIRIASGEIIGIINSDDWYNQGAFEEVVNCFAKSDCEIVYGDMITVADTGVLLRKCAAKINQDHIYFRMIYSHATVFVKRYVYEKYGVFDCRYKIVADYDAMLRFYSQGVVFTYLPFDVAFFRIGGVSTTKMWRCRRELKKVALTVLKNKPEAEKQNYLPLVRWQYEKSRNLCIKKFFFSRIIKSMQAEYFMSNTLREILGNKKTYAIFCTGDVGVECYKWLKAAKMSVAYFLDNSLVRQNELLENLPIKNPAILVKDKNKVKVLIATVDYPKEIGNQLEKLGLRENMDYINFEEVQRQIILKYVEEKIPLILTKNKERHVFMKRKEKS